jgi:hypothetical protein
VAAKAGLFYALEVLRAHQELGIAIAETSLASSSEWKDPDFEMMRSRVQAAIARYQAERTVSFNAE